MAVAMLLPQSLDHLGMGSETLWGEPRVSQWSFSSSKQFKFLWVCWQHPGLPALPSADAFVIPASMGQAADFTNTGKIQIFPLAKPQELGLSLRFPRTLLPGTERPSGNGGMGGICSPACLHLSFVSRGLAFQTALITKGSKYG